MRSKRTRRAMITAEDALEQVRPSLAQLVKHRQRAVGSRMAAYNDVGAPLGRSASWVRKVLGRAPDVVVGLHDYLNITKLCERIEASTARNEAAAELLRTEINAIHSARKSRAPMERFSHTPGVSEVSAGVDQERK